MSQAEIFPASHAARRAISRRAYLLFAAGAALLACGGAGASIAIAGSGEPGPVVILAAVVGVFGLTGLIAGLVTLVRLQQPIRVEVSPYRLVWREGHKTAAVEFGKVVRVELVKDREERRGTFDIEYPVVRFIENDGEMMEFDVTFEDRGEIHAARFDARGITAAVLPHLPRHAVIAPAVSEFVHTGEVDLDLLPAR